jgi:hypothetical protein
MVKKYICILRSFLVINVCIALKFRSEACVLKKGEK